MLEKIKAMSGSNFVDYVKIFCRSGAGGNGSTHLHRDKLTMKGGPDGGDGGRGDDNAGGWSKGRKEEEEEEQEDEDEGDCSESNDFLPFTLSLH